MPRRLGRVQLLAAIAIAAAVTGPRAAPPPGDRPNRVAIAYVAPTHTDDRRIHQLLREHRVLERFKALLGPLRLPRTLKLETASCDGEANAWYDEDTTTVTVCYEYFDRVLRKAPARTSEGKLSADDALTGAAIEVFLHETAHALFHLLHVPVLGREEDAADQLAAYMMLHLDPDLSRRVVATVVGMYELEASTSPPTREDFADAHAVAAQRLYNLLCLAYGAEPRRYADVVARAVLPPERAEGCEAEYRQVAYAARQLIEPHVDPLLRRKLQVRKLLKPASSGGTKVQ